jgi:DNA-binding ferritin-like protein
MEKKLIQFKKKDMFLREQEEPETKQEEKTETGKINKLVSKLLHSRIQVHIFHWQTKSQSSFAEHMALGGFYEGIGDLTDGLVESYQGKHDIITGYDSLKLEDYKNVEQLISYFKSLDAEIEKDRKSVKESYIQNQIDTIQELLYSTLYKLRFLK